MGIDIYAQWRGQTENERMAQLSVPFSTIVGRVGYLREAYHGEPYATHYLCAEAFDSEEGEARIRASTLRERLEKTLLLAAERERKLYQSSDEDIADVQQSYREFVALCERKEQETGEPVRIVASY
jgi:hypothetical protein